MKKQLAAVLAVAIVIPIFFSFLLCLPSVPSVLAQYSWTDTIKIYKYVKVLYTDIHKIMNNETVSVDVYVYVTFTERINFLDYYKLSANGTDFIVISAGNVILAQGIYFGLEPGQMLCFTVEAEGASSLSKDDTVTIGVKVEFWSAAYIHDVAVTAVTLSKTVAGQGFPIYINVTVQNQGNFNETFEVIAYANTTIVNTETVTLEDGTSKTINLSWDTTSFAKGNYNITVFATPVPEEVDPSDNTLENGTVIITIPGDINGDRIVNVLDLYTLGKVYSSSPSSSNWNSDADVNGDLVVNVLDLGILLNNYGETDS